MEMRRILASLSTTAAACWWLAAVNTQASCTLVVNAFQGPSTPTSTPFKASQCWTGTRRKTATATCTTTACHAYRHALAILALPETSLDKIANEAVIETVLPTTRKLSVVLRCCRGNQRITTAALRSYVGEIYSQLWDCALQMDSKQLELPSPILPDVVVYPQNLPNTAPESWIDIQPDLDCVCSHDDIVGWSSIGRNCRSYDEQEGNGMGGLDEHVRNVNVERRQRKLPPVKALHVPNFETIQRAAAEVIFLEDEEPLVQDDLACPTENDDEDEFLDDDVDEPGNTFLSGAPATAHLYDGVCVGGTFDGLHFGHRKLLTLAASSVTPVTGRLLVGVTVDEMLQQKTLAEYIPPFHERCAGVRDFLDRLAPGMKNRVSIVPLQDKFGPPGQKTTVNSNTRGGLAANQFDALVLSHETLETGYMLNQHRVTVLGLPPLQLLCTRRTEAHGMSSTALRRLRKNQQQVVQMQQEEALAVKKQQQRQQ